MSDDLGAEFWEEHYRDHAAKHQHRPNAQLVAEAGRLEVGRALDAGCGEGADATWLAARGWRVTAVDIAATALQRAQEYAAELGPDVTSRIDWVQADLTGWTPPPERFDLVSAQYVHVPGPARAALFARLAASVAPGGTLLVAGHHPSDLETSICRGEQPDLYLTAEEIASDLDPERWEVAADTRSRAESDHQGHGITVTDSILRAHRRPQ